MGSKKVACGLFSLLLFSMRALGPVQKSRFQVSGLAAGEPRPKSRRVIMPTPFRLEAVPVPAFAAPALPLPAVRPVRSRAPVSEEPLGAQVGSVRVKEDVQRRKWAQQWVMCARQEARSCSWLKGAGVISDDMIMRTFMDRAPSTLRKHLYGWRRWTSFCHVSRLEVANPTLAQLFTFLDSLAIGSFLDRGRQRKASAVSTLAALQFGAWKLGFTHFSSLLSCAPVQAWKKGEDWNKTLRREAVPLPLAVLRKLEEVAGQCAEDSFFVAAMLRCWAGLRWSDAQRLRLDQMTCSGGVLRGLCWRTKSRKRGMVWGCVTHGFLQCGWGEKFFEHVQHIRAKNRAQDFLLVFDGRPMSYSMGLAQFRRCLHIHCGMTFENCLLFTLRSLKTTLLTYASQCRVDRAQRAAQGRRQLTDANQCVELYGRDDVQPQLACQRSILQATAMGMFWPMVELVFALPGYGFVVCLARFGYVICLARQWVCYFA